MLFLIEQNHTAIIRVKDRIFSPIIRAMDKHYHYETIARAITYIRHNYENQPSLEEIAEHVHLSQFHFQRLFKEWAGISPKSFLQYTTIEHAKKALITGHSTLETSYEVGLSGNSRLHDLFIKIEACTPGNFKKRSQGLIIYISETDSPFGTISIAETERGISNISFGPKEEILSLDQYKNAEFKEGLKTNGSLIKEYFKNWKVPSTKISLDLIGTSFQIQVWKALLKIPPSHLSSYRSISESINRPNSSRAVGNAVGKNPIAYFIPCHRVIRNNGEFGNYHWGEERKVILNAYESALLDR